MSAEGVPRRVDEADDVGVEGAIHRIHDSQFSQSLHRKQQHDTDDQIANNLVTKLSATGHKPTSGRVKTYQSSWTTIVKSASRADEQTCTYSTTCRAS
jgi:hypothetical protein